MEATGRQTFRRKLPAILAATASLACACAAPAEPNPGLVGLEVMDRATGEELQTWSRHGRAYVAGSPGDRYGLRLTNRTGGRVLLVLSVDGINVITGETARYDQRGYVLRPYQTYDVNGWRKSDSEVAAFTFAALPQSYAARTGRPGDVGVIGLAAFTERSSPPSFSPPPTQQTGRERFGAPPPLPIPAAPKSISESAAPAAEASSARRAEDRLGTAHGEREWSYAPHTAFERATPFPQSTWRIEYDTYAHLAERGVIPTTSWPGRRPRPFPGEPDGAGYVPDPPEAR